MQTFQANPKMTTMQGVFYPTGYAVVLFPDADNADEAGRRLQAAGFADSDMQLLTPPVILRDIGGIDGESEDILPLVGTEGTTVQHYVKLARDGHYGLLVKTDSDDVSEQMMVVVREMPMSYGQRYRMLAIEDLE